MIENIEFFIGYFNFLLLQLTKNSSNFEQETILEIRKDSYAFFKSVLFIKKSKVLKKSKFIIILNPDY